MVPCSKRARTLLQYQFSILFKDGSQCYEGALQPILPSGKPRISGTQALRLAISAQTGKTPTIHAHHWNIDRMWRKGNREQLFIHIRRRKATRSFIGIAWSLGRISRASPCTKHIRSFRHMISGDDSGCFIQGGSRLLTPLVGQNVKVYDVLLRVLEIPSKFLLDEGKWEWSVIAVWPYPQEVAGVAI
ncbi:hypothetical protein D5086_016687 [Populus alba]|uniref:Uncharacterized protein n=1 Tax=Populus alba TaxID=43335 RepID=A0ACC4BVB9_POPAL